jgi:hypothetical protein
MAAFHKVVDLSPYAGKTITLRLVSDTEGEWGCREAMLNYVTVIHWPSGGGKPSTL